MNELETLAMTVGKILMKHRWRISTAESCTGGLLAGTLTAVPGISEVFDGSVVAYQNRVKEELLQVPHEILVRHGAVSTECAAAMAEGARKLFRTDFALSTTGIAGPGGGTPEKPVGTVCFGIASSVTVRSIRKHFEGDRETVRLQSVRTALELLLEEMENRIEKEAGPGETNTGPIKINQ